MRREYDFTQGERGKFFQKNAIMHTPVYLDEDVAAFIEDIAQRKSMEFSSVANQILRRNMKLAKVIQQD